jgi:hypothetical protein
MKLSIVSWLLRIMVSVILLQTLYFKFTGADESIYIFSTLGIEPYGRIGTGVLELIVVILILMPRTILLGALLGCGLMFGAVFSHIFILGIEVKDDGGELFTLALITFFCCSFLVFQNKDKIQDLLKFKI